MQINPWPRIPPRWDGYEEPDSWDNVPEFTKRWAMDLAINGTYVERTLRRVILRYEWLLRQSSALVELVPDSKSDKANGDKG